jgi:ABC-2 type transport system ATP-binding protein
VARPWMEELYDSLGLRSIIEMRFDHYSTGQKQRLAIARGLLSKPKILLMDEPTKGVDPIGAAHLVEIIRERIIALWNPTILITSHNLSEIQRLCGRIALMDQGRIIAMGPLEQLRAMIQAVDTYQLKVADLSRSELAGIAEEAEAATCKPEEGPDGTTDLEVCFRHDSEGFPRLITGIVNRGGRVLACSSVEASLEDIFHTLIAKQTDPSPKEQ